MTSQEQLSPNITSETNDQGGSSRPIEADTSTSVEGWKLTDDGLQHAFFANPEEREEFGYVDAETIEMIRENDPHP